MPIQAASSPTRYVCAASGPVPESPCPGAFALKERNMDKPLTVEEQYELIELIRSARQALEQALELVETKQEIR